MTRQLSCALIVSSLITITGCSSIIYKQPIQQGNIITTYEAKQVKVGMNISQVTRILGTPVLHNPYPSNQLVYVYTLKPGHAGLQSKRLFVTFRNGRVSAIN